MKNINILAFVVVSFLVCGTSSASLIKFTYNSTVGAGTTTAGVAIGEALNYELVLDNGGSTTLSQTWSSVDFVSLDVTTSGGYSFSSNGADSGSFTTDGAGNVVGLVNWNSWMTFAGFDSNVGSISNAGWWLNGMNEVIYNGDIFTGVWDVNVSDNNSPTSWSAALVSVPEPSTLAIFALGMIGLASRRFKK